MDRFKRRAQKEKEVIEENLGQLNVAPDSARTIDEAVQFYYTTPHWDKLSDSTKVRDRLHIRAFQRWCMMRGIKLMEMLDLALVNEYQSWYLKEHRKLRRGCDPSLEKSYEEFPRGVNNNMSAVRNVFTEEMMRKDRQLSTNPFRPAVRWDGIAGVEKLSFRYNTKRSFTELEWKLFHDALPGEEYRHIFSILYYTLCRSSELRYMEQAWIAPDFSTITVPYYMTKTGKKTGRDNVVNCHKELRPHLEYFLQMNEGKKYLVHGDEFVPVNYFLKALRRTCVKIEKKYPGMDFSKVDVHSVRRTGATFLLHHGAKIDTISRMLNHSSISTTLIYLGMADDKRVIEDLNLLPKVDTRIDTRHKIIQAIA